MEIQHNKLKILFISSSSASGSTLLEALLGTQSGVHTLGEVGILGRWLKKNELCSCGEPLSKCLVWSKLNKKLSESHFDDEVEEYIAFSSFVSRWYSFFYTLFFPPGGKLNEKIMRYAEKTRSTFFSYIDILEERTGEKIDWLVDSTKSHWRLQWLQSSGFFDVYVIHLAKDPRAYVYSMDKAYSRKQKKNSKSATKNAAKLAYGWVSANLAILILRQLRFQKSKRMFIRYDDLASNYVVVMEAICKWINVPFDEERANNFRNNEDHAIGGNPMRTEDRPVQLDKDWVSALSPARSWIVWIVAWPLAVFFGFRRNNKS